MKQIALSRGKYAMVDDGDYPVLSRYTWSCDSNGYAVRHETKQEYGMNKRKMVKMHRQVFHAPEGQYIDHINRDKLDNRKCNLRIVDNHTNQRNTKVSTLNTSGFKGVYWDKKYKRWCARMTHYGKRIFGGGFCNKIEAVKAYERLVLAYG